MAVTLIVEDGTGRSDANALISLDDFKTYCFDRGKDVSSKADYLLNQAIIRASTFLTYAFIWDGVKVNLRAQKMPFPRWGLSDRENYPILTTEVPREVKDACCEITYVEAITPGTMTPTVTLSARVKMEQVGPIRTEYSNLFNNAADERPVLLIVREMLWPFLSNFAPNPLSGSSIRV